jgi:hypothetical protein
MIKFLSLKTLLSLFIAFLCRNLLILMQSSSSLSYNFFIDVTKVLGFYLLVVDFKSNFFEIATNDWQIGVATNNGFHVHVKAGVIVTDLELKKHRNHHKSLGK